MPSSSPTRLDKFEIGELLGRGNHAMVWEGRQRDVDRRVALKVATSSDPTRVRRMVREAQLLASLEHPGVVHVFELGSTTEGVPFLVMERIDGDNLRDELAATGPARPAEVVRIGALLLEAAHAVHEAGLLHRDIKPSNVMHLWPDRKGARLIKLIDFGVGLDERAEGDRITGPTDVVGTPAYLAPEQLIPHLPVDRRTDLYSIGATLYELLTGERPFAGRDVEVIEQVLFRAPRPASQVRPGLTRALDAVLAQAMSKAPSDRFETATAMRRALLDCPIPLG